MREISVTTTAVIGSVSAQLQPDALMALPKKMSIKIILHRRRRKLQFDSDSISYPPPKYATFTVPDEFQHMILCDCGSEKIGCLLSNCLFYIQ